MPELPEVETYRQIAEAGLDREITKVVADDSWFLKKGTNAPMLRSALEGEKFTAARRIGKLLLLDVSNDHVLGLRFGMSGRLFVDDDRLTDDYAYAPRQARPEWNRFGIDFVDGWMRLNDARRLGGIELDPDEDALGFDALTLSLKELRAALATSKIALKARLMDQQRIAGVGNLIADEVLWRAGLDPARPAGKLDDTELKKLHRQLRSTVDVLMKRGGSHTGDLMVNRVRGGVCPKDGHPLDRRTIGGRTSYSCPEHQL